jgi:hypothetical protein
MPNKPAIVALAGRRIDAGDARVERFPLHGIGVVAGRLRALFGRLRCTTLVCSAANGADLVALQVARELGVRTRIVLPFAAARFREVSVVDRPGGELWGWLFDDLVREARAAGDLVVLASRRRSQHDAFAAANERIVDEAIALARAGRRKAVVAGVAVWDGASRGRGDATAGFVKRIRSNGLPVHTVPLGRRD